MMKKMKARAELGKVGKLSGFKRMLTGMVNHSAANEECAIEKEMGVYQICLFEMERDRAFAIERMQLDTVK